jgi:pimeloyl-ACP methyl ester carboxylesterase
VGSPSSSNTTPPVELRSGELLLRGLRVHYVEAGEGPTLLLVHGSLSDHRAWRRVIAPLAARHRVVVPDLPGFGKSEKPSRYPFTREAFAETLCDLLAGLQAPRAHVVGAGLGGTIGLTLAADHPECVDRLAVLSCALGDAPRSLRARIAAVPVLGGLWFKQMVGRRAFHGYFRREVFAPGYGYDGRALDELFDAFDPPEARECAWRTLLHAESDLSGLEVKVAKVRAPTAILWGDRDRLPVSHGLRLARRIRGARLETVPNAAGAPAEEQPEATVAALLRHLGAERDGPPRALPAPTRPEER